MTPLTTTHPNSTILVKPRVMENSTPPSKPISGRPSLLRSSLMDVAQRPGTWHIIAERSATDTISAQQGLYSQRKRLYEQATKLGLNLEATVRTDHEVGLVQLWARVAG